MSLSKRNGSNSTLSQQHPLDLDHGVVHHPKTTIAGKASSKKRIRVSVVLKPALIPKTHPTAAKIKELLKAAPHGRPRLKREEIENNQSADENDVRTVEQFAKSNDLSVVEVSQVRHEVILEGTVAAIARAFGVDLIKHAPPKGNKYLAHQGIVSLPTELRTAVDCVLGLDDLYLLEDDRVSFHDTKPLSTRAFSPLEVAEYYRFPKGLTGRGQRICLIEFAGGYHPSDIKTFFKKLGITPPKITDRCLPGIRNSPLGHKLLGKIASQLKHDPIAAMREHADVLGAFANTLEVTMDIQIAGSLAPGAEIEVLFAPGTGQGWRDAIHAALEEPQADVISISWGNSEYRFSDHHVKGIELALQAARLHHATVCCASGDFGSRNSPPISISNGMANVAFPASSPLVLACGGTTLHSEGDKIIGETAWNGVIAGTRFATGGGMSGRFPLPSYQKEIKLPAMDKKVWSPVTTKKIKKQLGRGIPDVSGNADAASGYELILGDETFNGGGTSAVAPLWAALIARLNEGLGYPLGWVNPVLYRKSVAKTFREVSDGHNDVSDGQIDYFHAGPGWDACTGLGTPDGESLLKALKALKK